MKKPLAVLMFILMITFCFQSYAAESLYSLEIEFFYPSQVSETKDININLYTPHCSVGTKSYEFNSSQLTLYILPEEGYRFSSASKKALKILGAEYITASVDQESGDIKLTVELSPDGSFEESGKMLTDTVTPDGIYVGTDGASTGDTLNDIKNVKADSLSFMQGKSVISIPCKIHYRNGKIGEHTTLRYDSVGMQEFNGKSPNLIITYTVLRSGGYSSTNIGLDILINGKKKYTLGGSGGDILAQFDRNSVEVEIPYDLLTQNDIVDIYINR